MTGWIRGAGFAWFSWVAGLLLAAPAALAAPSRPNIVIILADDMGYGDLACYGHPSISTPNLDKMAAEGMRFTDFYVAAAVCTPSRAGLLTGRLPLRSGMAGGAERSVLMTNSTGGLPTNEITIATALKTKGYTTACIGKWHLGHEWQFLPTQHGFDHFYGVRFANNMEPTQGVSRPKQPLANLEPKRQWWHMALLRNSEIIESDTDPHTLTARYTAEASQFIRQNRTKPFFLYLAHTYPHAPLFASEKFQNRSGGGRSRGHGRGIGLERGGGARNVAAGEIGGEHAGLFHERQRALAAAETGRWLGRTSAWWKRIHLGRRVPRAGDSLVAGQN